jgi:hypothetical protein
MFVKKKGKEKTEKHWMEENMLQSCGVLNETLQKQGRNSGQHKLEFHHYQEISHRNVAPP